MNASIAIKNTRLKPLTQFALKKLIGAFLFAIAVFNFNTIKAQKLTAQVSKTKVLVGEVFQVNFSANGAMAGFKPPSFADFDVYSGPNQSTSIQIINGSMSQSISYSYLIAARKEGKLTIGPASASINGQKSESNAIVIEAIKGQGNQNAQNKQQQNQINPFDPFGQFEEEEQAQQQDNQKYQYNSGASDDEIFVRTYLSKKSCYLGEQIVLTQKVYSRLNLRGFQNFKAPNYNGFWAKDEDRQRQINLNVENLDGINYYVADFSKTFIFPQRTGKLTIDPIEIDCIVRKKSNKPTNIFDAFFGGGYQDVLVKIKGKTVTLDVQALPETNKPAQFSGGVGKYSFKAEMNRQKVKVNESLNLKMTISGNGNINLTEAPKINFPSSFETYEPKVNEHITQNGGVNGSKIYDYLIIPRQSGEFVLKDINFSYFDPDKKQYISIPSPEFKITVEPGAGATANENAQVYTPKQEIEKTENDIRYLKTGNLNLSETEQEFFNSGQFWLLMLLPPFAFIGFLVTRKQYLIRNSDLALVKQRKALQFAKKQLSQAEKHLKSKSNDKFYEEVFSALNKYASFRLGIPVAELNKDIISKLLAEKNVSPLNTIQFTDLIAACEFARYAPGGTVESPEQTFEKAKQIIVTIENELKA